MAEYHGDLMHKVGNVYARDDDRNYLVAIVLAFLFGAIGIHRFYLNDNAIAFAYFIPFSITALMGAAMLDFTLLLWYCAIASVAILLEIAYFFYCWVNR